MEHNSLCRQSPKALSSVDAGPSQTFSVCGVPFAVVDLVGAARTIVERSRERRPFEVHLCSAYPMSLVDRDSELRFALDHADLNLPDGTPVSWFGRSKGVRKPVRGPALVGEVAQMGVGKGVRHYLFGGADRDVAKRMAIALERHAPGIEVVGYESPPWSVITDEMLDEVAERASRVGANIVWIGISSPKQDYLVPRLARRMDCVVVPVGAAFDFWSGDVSEAPQWLHGSGLEWLYRLIRQPRRLWRRYLFGNLRFVRSALTHAWSKR